MLSSKEQKLDANQEEQMAHLTRLASVGFISAGVAHEVRNPLTVSKGFLQLLQKEISHPYLDMAFSELERAIEILQNMLQVTKSDEIDESFRQVFLCTELNALLQLFQDKLYDVQVQTRFSDATQSIWGRPHQLKKALFNLLKNAFEAIPGQGTITIMHFNRGDQIVVSIKDSGEGISEEKLSRVGAPFFSTKPDGTGLGLVQVFAALNDHGANMEVQSKPGEGTTFTLYFPQNRRQESI